jgi:hypothetical protein
MILMTCHPYVEGQGWLARATVANRAKAVTQWLQTLESLSSLKFKLHDSLCTYYLKTIVKGVFIWLAAQLNKPHLHPTSEVSPAVASATESREHNNCASGRLTFVRLKRITADNLTVAV